jgi:hypothetical protein
MRTVTFLLAIGLALPASPAHAQRRAWSMLGSTAMTAGWDHGTIRVQTARSFREVRLCVARNAVNLNSFRIDFARGGTQWVTARQFLRPGQCTLPSTLRSAPQGIRTVRVDFTRLRTGVRPMIRVEAR